MREEVSGLGFRVLMEFLRGLYNITESTRYPGKHLKPSTRSGPSTLHGV